MGKKLGQHFLINREKVGVIIDALSLREGDLVVEIGTGRAELTKFLLEKKVDFVGIEKDEKLARELAHSFEFPILPAYHRKARAGRNFKRNYDFEILDSKRQIIFGDALEILPELSLKLGAVGYKLVGNIPYYITGRLLRIIGELEHKPEVVVLTVQRQVGERLCAKPPKMNLLAASVQFWADVEVVDFISAKDFRPKPKVDSAIVRLRIKDLGSRKDLEEGYYELIKILFKQPRKTIKNNLSTSDVDRLFWVKEAGIDPGGRPQDLSVENIIDLVRIKREKGGG